MPLDLILGTAGHIDHGKTSLVKALTGVDTDRLPEEKRRGITIELGFAELLLGEYRLGIVDVPGHERFVRNMLAGATGVDLALLVIAADDSVKPQTREHLEILKLLGLSAGVIALAKADLVEPDWLALVEEEIRALMAGTFLAGAAIVPTSVRTGQGLDALRQALHAAAAQAAAHRSRSAAGPFRLPIDRAFSLAGHGTVVTGSVASGTARLGDELELQPLGLRVRVRGLEQHDHAVDAVHLGQRAAVNLAGVRPNELERGQELASVGHLRAARVVSVELQLAPDAARPLKDRARVHLHLGTAEAMASVRLLEAPSLEPGQTALAQLHLSRAAVATWNQPFIVRSESPVVTIGGGRVLDPEAAILRRAPSAAIGALATLRGGEPRERVAATLYLRHLADWQPGDLWRLAGVETPEPLLTALEAQGILIPLRVSPTQAVRVHRQVLDELLARVLSALETQWAHAPLASTVPRATLRQRLGFLGEARRLDAALDWFAAAGQLVITPRGISPPGRQVQLGEADQQAYDTMLARFESAAFQPPSITELAAELRRPPAVMQGLARLAGDRAELVEISSELALHHRHEARLRQLILERLAEGAGLTVSEIRELLGTSRKYAVPLCEYLDRIGLTRRDGDRRLLAGPRGK